MTEANLGKNMPSPVAFGYQTISTSHPLFPFSTFGRTDHSPDQTFLKSRRVSQILKLAMTNFDVRVKFYYFLVLLPQSLGLIPLFSVGSLHAVGD
jgi:hypothetical protein